MKNRNSLTKLTLLLAVLMTLGAARAQAGDILPGVSFGFGPVGISMNQTAQPIPTPRPRPTPFPRPGGG